MNLTKRSKLCIGSGAQGFRKKQKSSLVRRHYHLKQAHSLLAVQKGISSTRELLVGEAERGHGRDRTARNAKGKRPTWRAYDISSVFRAMAFCGVTLIMGLFFFLGSSGGMSYFVSTSSSIECHPVDSKGMAGSNTLTQTLDRLLVDPHLLLSMSTGFSSTLTCQHFIRVGCKLIASFTNLSQSEISQVRCGLVTWKCGATI